jgi:4-diphosphocytidyl-2-C-methyl-D-erythritol kinase
MAGKVRILSPAKINLHLDVYPKREDGYHNLLSIFRQISWCDEIELCSLKEFDVCKIEGNFDFPVEENIIWKSWNIFRNETGIKTGVAFTVQKRIPQGAGLGGGSSNAGAALRGLNVLFRTGLSDERLAELGAKAGSDVPFFCRAVAALVEGRGELIRPLSDRRNYFIVIVVPKERISTRDAYRWIDEMGEFPDYEVDGAESILKRYLSEEPAKWNFRNSFFPVLRDRFSVFSEIRDELLEAGAAYANVSGSGSAMYGLFADRDAASRVRTKMADRYPIVELTNFLERISPAVLQ